MKKKLLATTLIVALAAGTLVGCGSTETSTETAVIEAPTEVAEVVVETEEVVEETETETETHEHEFTEANFQEPATCIICGETEGEPLTAEYEEKGIETVSEWDTPYEYVTQWSGTDEDVTIQAVFSNCQVIESDEEAGLEAEEGYEWITYDLTWTVEGSGSAELLLIDGDYYDEDTYWESSDSETNYNSIVNYYGVDYPKCIAHSDLVSQDRDGGVEITVAHNSHRVPKGYDGTIIALVDKYVAESLEDGSHIDEIANENTLFFRVIP